MNITEANENKLRKMWHNFPFSVLLYGDLNFNVALGYLSFVRFIGPLMEQSEQHSPRIAFIHKQNLLLRTRPDPYEIWSLEIISAFRIPHEYEPRRW